MEITYNDKTNYKLNVACDKIFENLLNGINMILKITYFQPRRAYVFREATVKNYSNGDAEKKILFVTDCGEKIVARKYLGNWHFGGKW